MIENADKPASVSKPYTMQLAPIHLYTLPRQLVHAKVHARPSAKNKSPYLCDVQLEDGSIAVCHNPALGCAGLVCAGADVMVMPVDSKSKGISRYVLYHVVVNKPEQVPSKESADVICIHPAVANDIAEAVAEKFLRCSQIRREVAVGNSRFDMCAIKDDKEVLLEVKNASIADTVCCLPRDRPRALKDAGVSAPLCAIFPYGNKQKRGLVSPRALKHATELGRLARKGKQAYILYLSQRTDVQRFKISTLDEEYLAAVNKAVSRGLRLRAFSIRWVGSSAYLDKLLPIDR
jgi:DNA-binding sugar fermentation-stimulating protein